MAKEAYYFSHDTNARRDPKILAMRNEFGNEGYGWYWILIEMLSEQEGYQMQHKQWNYYGIAMDMQCDANAVEKFINSLINDYELLVSDGDYFWSESLLRRMELKEAKRKKRVEAGKKGARSRWGKDETGGKKNDEQKNDSNAIANAKQSHGDGMANDGKGKESKEKESKEKESKGATTGSGDNSPDKFNALSSFEQLWAFPNFVQKEDLNHLIDLYGDDLVTAAVKLAGSKDVKKGQALSFIESALREWADNNVKTVDQAREYQKNRNKQFKKSDWQKNRNSHNRQESLPEWARDGYQAPKDEKLSPEDDAEIKARLNRILEKRKDKKGAAE